MSLWIRYNEQYNYWEVSPQLAQAVFSMLKENFPLDVAFSRWLDIKAFESEHHSHRQSDSLAASFVEPVNSEEESRPRSFFNSDSPSRIVPMDSYDDEWGPRVNVAAIPVSNPGECRLYFQKSTNKLMISENGGAYVAVI
jgi:hypothetical protein